MKSMQSVEPESFSSAAVDAAIKIGMIALMVSWCFQIVRPFILPIVWGGIIAIALYPLVQSGALRTGIAQARVSILVTLLVLALLLVPTVLFSGALFSETQQLIGDVQQGTLEIPPPKASVADWPLIGDKLYQFWSRSSTNLAGVLNTYAPEIKAFASSAAMVAGGVGATVLQFVISIIIAGVFMANAKGANVVFHQVAVRLAGGHGESFASLAVATVRSVVQGVIGVALIQALLAGVGMAMAGVPATGLWMLMVLILAIVQLPPILVLAPVMAYVFSVESTTVAVVFMIWGILVSASDAVLKPLLMGRGVDIPMLVILIGALGGMMMSGIVGLFVGAVVLALGYKLLVAWVAAESGSDAEGAVEGEPAGERSRQPKG
ncbi:Predicted PurR-regulated permease PerM [Ferrimonas sediminum]|uniref:Predicted PurR-regulated permease PerM n=1 Tax=Ferrimonas sediminum TaxID=718193 RepID=A0A1G8TQN3_9GAMM|nr:AI-2E family transporter [Ferrimonas sediminum]SDJ43832.1 Predicted PurR-regulated permease PerM [Ferrimonas sediminum]